MDKYTLAAALLFASACGGTVLACLSTRMRDVFFFLLVTLSALTEKIDVNFMSREWYRGTTCGFEVSLVDILAISLFLSAILTPRTGEKRWFWPASLGLMLVYFAFNIGCVAMADPKLFGLFALSKIVRGLIVFGAAALYVRSERELRIFIFALGLIVCYEAFKGIEQRFRYGLSRVFGDLDAPNSLSMYLCMTAPIFVAALNSQLPRILKALSVAAIAMAGLGVLLTVSRAGVITLALVLFLTMITTISWKITPRKLLVSVCVTVAVVGALAQTWKSLSRRFEEASLKQEYENKHAQGRGFYLRMAAALVEDHPLGVGPNNWSYWVSNKYGPREGFKYAPYPGTDKKPRFYVAADANVDDPQAAPAHSLGALTVGELGFGGLFLLLLLWLRWFQMGASFLWKRTAEPMRRIGIGILFGTMGIFLQSLTEWVFHQTAIYFTFHILLGVLASLYYLKKKANQHPVEEEDYVDESSFAVASEPVGGY